MSGILKATKTVEICIILLGEYKVSFHKILQNKAIVFTQVAVGSFIIYLAHDITNFSKLYFPCLLVSRNDFFLKNVGRFEKKDF